MNAKNRSTARVGLVLCGALAVAVTGCRTSIVHSHPRTVYVPAPTPVVHVPAAPAPVVIHSESDFYEPLGAYGRWAVVGNYGRCWIPTRVEAGWRPYGNGYWQRTDAGWYWASDEPWAWATYHYGRWDWRAEFGWIWVPQTQWGPAWVSWREGGGYVGWAPLRPSVSIGVSIGAVDYEPAFASRAFVFVEHRRMLEPVRSKTVIVNNTKIINKTVNITKVNVVNKTVINEGPRVEVIERESGRKVHTIPAREIRHREEARVAARERNNRTALEREVQRPVGIDSQPAPEPPPTRRNVQVVEREPVIAKPTERVPEAAHPIARTTPVRPEVNGATRDHEKRETETTAKGRAARVDEVKARSEAQPERVNPSQSPTRTFERPAEVAKPAVPPVATDPAHNEVRRGAAAERIVSTRPPTVQPQPITRPTSAQPDVSNATRDYEKRETERAAKARVARAAEAKAKSETKPERVSGSRPPTRALERPAEVAKPALPPVAMNPAHSEMRRKEAAERIVSARPPAVQPQPRSEARTEPKAEIRQPSRRETAAPVVTRRPVAPIAEQQTQKSQVSSPEKSRAERVQANKKKETKEQKKGEERETATPAAGSPRQPR